MVRGILGLFEEKNLINRELFSSYKLVSSYSYEHPIDCPLDVDIY